VLAGVADRWKSVSRLF